MALGYRGYCYTLADTLVEHPERTNEKDRQYFILH